ncbi:MAG: RHS repeat-associated core domain-containing protein [Planctomycetaceae bacterium]
MLRTRDTDANGSLDETLYALQDANWNITALADTSGTIVERFVYDAYGRSTVLEADFTADGDGISDYAWEYRFTSREHDAETGMHYFRARYYHDGIGRFIGRDPLGFVDGGSMYTAYFVFGRTDPGGTMVVDPGFEKVVTPGRREMCRKMFVDHKDLFREPIDDYLITLTKCSAEGKSQENHRMCLEEGRANLADEAIEQLMKYTCCVINKDDYPDPCHWGKNRWRFPLAGENRQPVGRKTSPTTAGRHRIGHCGGRARPVAVSAVSIQEC